MLSAIVTITVAQNASICDEEELNAFIPNVRDCNAWFRCGPKGPEPGNCPEEYNFNPITRSCDWPENVECFNCPNDQALSTHIMNRSCRSFIRCVAGIPSQLMCEPGLQFNNKTGQCDLQSVVQCTVRFQCPLRLPIDGSVIAIRDPDNCSVYVTKNRHFWKIDRLIIYVTDITFALENSNQFAENATQSYISIRLLASVPSHIWLTVQQTRFNHHQNIQMSRDSSVHQMVLILIHQIVWVFSFALMEIHMNLRAPMDCISTRAPVSVTCRKWLIVTGRTTEDFENIA